MDRSTFLHAVPPGLIMDLCDIIDSGDDKFGWRGLAARIVPSWLEVRRAEKLEAAGKSPARELLWSWAQRNPTVGDLIQVLEDMGHNWALRLLAQQDTSLQAPTNETQEPRGYVSTPVKCEESLHQDEIILSSALNSNVSGPTETQKRLLTYQNILEGTRRFDHDMKFAKGHSSDLYKSTVGNETFAVKRFKMGDDPSWKERWDWFTRDTESRHIFQHPNILNMMGCFSEDGNYCLVYRYLPNGSLSQRLHHPGDAPYLSWQQRLVVIKGMAKALHHLHTAQSCPLVCGNVTSGHILLDDGLQPQLSNVGLACLHQTPPAQLRQTSTFTAATGLNRHLLGYLPPEFVRDRKLSCGVDVYSFGIVMMETITGLTVVEESPKRSPLRDILSLEMEDGGGVDSCVRFLDPEAGPWPHAIALSLLRLALACTAPRPRSRPHMQTVLRELSQLLPVPSLLSLDSLQDPDPRCVEPDLPVTCRPPSPTSTPSPPQPPPPLRSPPPSRLTEDCLVSADVRAGWARPLPCECSQSEVTFWGSCKEDELERRATEEEDLTALDAAVAVCRLTESVTEARAEEVDLYNSWPVQCSCQADSGELGCEDCRANGFTLEHGDDPSHSSEDVSYSLCNGTENRTRKAKLVLHQQGLLSPEELVSL